MSASPTFNAAKLCYMRTSNATSETTVSLIVSTETGVVAFLNSSLKAFDCSIILLIAKALEHSMHASVIYSVVFLTADPIKICGYPLLNTNCY